MWSYKCDIRYKNSTGTETSSTETDGKYGYNEEAKSSQFDTNTQSISQTVALDDSVNEEFSKKQFSRKCQFPVDDSSWTPHKLSEFLFFGIVTHESRSSLTNEIFIP
jgi:hypothetical protein